MRLSTVRDFKTAYRYAVTGGDQFLAQVSEKGEYLASERDEARYSIAALKYGRQFDISWEAIINDDLDALKDTPTRFAMAAARTEHRLAVGQYAQDSGGGVAHATSGQLYSTLAGEVNETTALLTIANLENGVEAMASFLDANGEPIMNRARYLVVPPALEMTARQILTSSQKVWSDNAAGPVAYPTNNVISQYGLTLIVDPYLPIMDVVNGGGGTTANQGWYLFADPRDIAAVEVAHLRGHERPEICMKASDKVTIGGGAINSMSGDFATDNILYRVRLVVGVTTLDWRATYFGGHTD
ncbi:MAG: Mu-like prophage major head subunit gpT family protein [Deltaproteobacteria bacterium]|nr:Mu-like prophage major head subunit gpT family protein [Deltaproteobacteria bacterium]